ncbi:PAS domain S-box protein [Crocinitomicaceae bacterium]|nr:PAS domain S-box protein [Crocinitomicaceae bacterium]
MIKKLLALLEYDSPRFRLFHNPENSFLRIASGQAFAALIVAPLYAYIMHRTKAPDIYVWNGIIYVASYLVICTICYFVKVLRSWLMNVFIFEFFVLTIVAYFHLRGSGFQQDELVFFFLFYLMVSISIQRLYPAILFQLGILLAFLADNQMLEQSPNTPFLVVGVFLIVGLSMCTVVYLRRQLLYSIKDYISYLKRIVNNPGSGYVLLKQSNLAIADNNIEALKVFDIEEDQLLDTFSSFFNEEERKVLISLKQGHKFKKQISLSRHNARNYAEIRITTVMLKNDAYLLATISNVTDEVLKREELQLKEKRYRNLYFRNKAGVFTLNSRTQVIEANDTFFKMFENSLKKGDRLFKDENYTDWSFIIESLKSSEKAQSYQTQYRLDSGSQKTFVFSWYIDEQTGYIEGSVIDLTSIEKANQALKESEEKYRLIYEESNDAILLLDGDRIVDANKRTEGIFQLSRKELLTKNLFHLSFDSDVNLEKRYQREKARLSTSRSIRFNWLFDGAESVVESEVSLVEVMIGNKLFYQCVIHDTTEQNKLAKEQLRAELAEETNVKLAAEIEERIKAETKLQEQFLRTRAIFESSSNTLLITSKPNGDITFFNSHSHNYFQNRFGLLVVKNRNFFEYLDGIVSPRRRRMLGIVFVSVRKGASRQYEVRLTRDGVDFWLELFINPIFDTEGDVVEVSMVAHDITEKKRSSMGIEESLKEKDVLLKEIHHRVKNNLQVISSILNLQSSFVSDENTLGILQESRNRIRSMAIIHENLYRTEDFASIKFDNYLRNLTANLIASYSVDRKIEFSADLQEVDLVLDQAIPCGLLTNELITNALKYAWEGKDGAAKIQLKLEQEGDMITLTIADNGVGLPQAFEEMQSDTLGLQLVTTLAEQLDAELSVDTKQGTEFQLSFENVKRVTIHPGT